MSKNAPTIMNYASQKDMMDNYNQQQAQAKAQNPSQMSYKMPGENIPSGYRKSIVQQYTPQQMQQHNQLYQHVGPDSYLSRLSQGDQATFDEMEAPALRQFNELQGGMASRFSGQGLGGRQSSGFKNASNAAAQDFASQLQSNRQSLQRQALNDIMGYSDMLLNQRPYDVGLAEKRQRPPGFWKTFGTSLAKSSGESFGKNFNFSGGGGGGGDSGGGAQLASMWA
jgi:hypothetical protein